MENYITEVDVLQEAKDCFLTYAEEVLTDRAIPNAEDGLLSAQRKLLWTMKEYLKMDNKSKTKKCNSIVGSTLLTSYFHGDQACYGVLCKMSQDYLMRYPLVQGQGALGTQEDNSMCASSRYTEAKPSQYVDAMFNDFAKDVVPLKETYNGEFMEPIILPALFPNALANGREAIGISMSHNSLPNNLTEVCNGIIEYIKNNNITTKELMEFIPGPDFPLGGTVINKKDIYRAFETGKSDVSLKIRGDYIIEGQNIIFTTIPYRTYRNKIKAQINDNLTTFEKYLDDFNDESSIGINRLVFKVKKDANIKTVVETIFRLTDLQTTVSYNMNFIINGTPKLCSLKTLIKAYVEHQTNVLLKATQYDKKKAEDRVHIINGLLTAIDKIDEVIQLIKQSQDKSDARNKLMIFLNIDELQANAILDMKLSRLTRIDKNELINEKKEKEAIIAECVLIIENEEHRNTVLIKKITDLKNKYGDERRTKLIDLEIPKEEKEIKNIEPEKCVAVMTENGSIKRIPVASFKTQRRNTKGVKTQEDITHCVIRTNTIDNLMLFTNQGQMYKLLVNDIPSGTNASAGTPASALIKMAPGEKVSVMYSIYRDTDAKYILFVSKDGYAKKTSLEEYAKMSKKTGVMATKVREGDELTNVSLFNDEQLLFITKKGMIVRIKGTDIPISSRIAIGVKAMNVADDDEIIAVLPIRDENDDLAVFSGLLGKRVKLKEFPVQSRNGKGLKLYKDKEVSGVSLVNDEDNLFIAGVKKNICISAKDIPLSSRMADGVAILKEGQIKSITKI